VQAVNSVTNATCPNDHCCALRFNEPPRRPEAPNRLGKRRDGNDDDDDDDDDDGREKRINNNNNNNNNSSRRFMIDALFQHVYTRKLFLHTAIIIISKRSRSVEMPRYMI